MSTLIFSLPVGQIYFVRIRHSKEMETKQSPHIQISSGHMHYTYYPNLRPAKYNQNQTQLKVDMNINVNNFSDI